LASQTVPGGPEALQPQSAGRQYWVRAPTPSVKRTHSPAPQSALVAHAVRQPSCEQVPEAQSAWVKQDSTGAQVKAVHDSLVRMQLWLGPQVAPPQPGSPQTPREQLVVHGQSPEWSQVKAQPTSDGSGMAGGRQAVPPEVETLSGS
jgi:hypothetical protein